MIFIQSSINDISTDDVIDWFIFLESKKRIERLNDVYEIERITCHLGVNPDLKISSNNESYDLSKIQSRWYRRGEFNLFKNKFRIYNKATSKLASKFQDYLNLEMNTILNLVENTELFTAENNINKAKDNNINQLDGLLKAKNCGMEIPETLITNEYKELKLFFEKHKKIITKGIFRNNIEFNIENKRLNFSCTTTLIDESNFDESFSDNAEEHAMPSLFQNYIEKKFELRIFYFNEKIYPMAIFSQENEKTKIDFRKYDLEHPNRLVPYQIPNDLRIKITAFMKLMDLNCGSIDMIYTFENKYVFLEVNPIGQYQWLEKSCNYPISKEIAKYLC